MLFACSAEAPVVANPEEAERAVRQVQKLQAGGALDSWEEMPTIAGDIPSTAKPGTAHQDLSPPRKGRKASPDLSPPRKRQREITPVARRRRDSPDLSPARRTRHDSPDASPPRRQRHGSPSPAPAARRDRHDSPDASPPRQRQQRSIDASPPRRKQRQQSPGASPPRQSRHDSPDASPPRRKGISAFFACTITLLRTQILIYNVHPMKSVVCIWFMGFSQDILKLSNQRSLPLQVLFVCHAADAASHIILAFISGSTTQQDMSPPRKRSRGGVADLSSEPARPGNPHKPRFMPDGGRAGKVTGAELAAELQAKAMKDAKQFAAMGQQLTGHGAETV